MRRGELKNCEFQQQLQTVLDDMRKEETKRLAERVKAEERICLDQKQSTQHANEVRAWEGFRIFIRGTATDGAEKKVMCCRVGKTFLSVKEDEGKDPVRIERSNLTSVRTPEERLLAILDEKIESARKHGMRRLESTSSRLEKLHESHMQNCAEFDKEMNSLAAFRSRVHAVLVHKGLIINLSNRKGS